MSDSNAKDALGDILHSLQGVFGRYNRSARTKAWHSVTDGKARAEVNKILNSPGYQITGIPRLLGFKEWLKNEPF